MANAEQLAILEKGVKVWNKWREQNPKAQIVLTETDLSFLNLDGANLSDADLYGSYLGIMHLYKTDFRKASLRKASLAYSHLSGANFSNADLRETNLIQAGLDSANFYRANLILSDLRSARLTNATFIDATLLHVIFGQANLDGADFSNAVIKGTLFTDVDLSNVRGLESVIHQGPSFVDNSTIRQSKGKIPLKFLRGCGFNDLEIEAARLAVPELNPEQVTDITYRIHNLYVGQGVQYYSCFISYNRADEKFAQMLYDDLQESGVRCWFAPKDMKIGDCIRPTIDQQIKLRDKLLVILSEASIQSEWVGDEVEAAIEEEKIRGRTILFPIRLDGAVLDTRDDWAAKIKRRRHIGDFSGWKKHSTYEEAFRNLLSDLKASSG